MGRSKRRRRNRRQRELTRESTLHAPHADSGDQTNVALVRTLALSILALACLVVAALLLGVRSYSLSMHSAAQQWPEIPCTIVRNGWERPRIGRHKLTLEYEYTYNGQTYRSNVLDLIPGRIGGYTYWRQMADERPEGSQSVCYVNPDNPSVAVLDRGHMDAVWGLIVVAIPFLVVGLGMSLAAARAYMKGVRNQS